MKLFCSQKDLDNALNIVNKAISPNNTLPVLNNILIKAEGKRLYFSSTNLEIAISCSIEADVRNEGSITVPAKLITNYISLVTDEKVEISVVEGGNLSINSSTSHTKVKCISADEFPLIPKIEKDQEFIVKTEDLHKAIDETVFAASVNTSRPVLSGVFITSKPDGLKLVATDSYRLAERGLSLVKASSTEVSCIVPARTMIEVSKIITKLNEKEVMVNISKNQILFSAGDVEVISRLIDGKFPDYEKIIPKEHKTKFEVSVEDLSLVLKRVSLFARENNNSVKLDVSSDGKLEVSSDETKVGEEKAEVLIKIDGENNKISLNSQYLLDVLNYVDDEKITFSINDKVSPALIKPLKREDYSYIIMPLKV
ncbi:DNA polymerase III subunit beta [Candidatus Peregrinibacteria bacterium CG10_big_fil_rev_8_21_14_0_10_36_19]|nr:MAG: DNA polymerase III subunit beta [Candidatus Peregrinibacteria bacterium CG10_big_fil_rev_8_21_14_0_10_36_19]